MWKAVATIAIWLLCSLIAIASTIDTVYSWEMTGIPLIVALLATFILYGIPALQDQDESEQSSDDISKKKRTAQDDPRMALLLDMMDDNEREAFKKRLQEQLLGEAHQPISDDGELFERDSLYDLMQDDEKRLRG